MADASTGLPPGPLGRAVWDVPLSTASPSPSIPRAAVIPPFWQMKPPEGLDIQATVRGTLAAGIGATLQLLPTVPFQVLPGYEAVLTSLLATVLAPLATLNITFQLRNNGAPVPGWLVNPFAVAANSISIPLQGTLQLPERSLLDVLVTNNAASGPWTLQVDFGGWQWPRIVRVTTFGESR